MCSFPGCTTPPVGSSPWCVLHARARKFAHRWLETTRIQKHDRQERAKAFPEEEREVKEAEFNRIAETLRTAAILIHAFLHSPSNRVICEATFGVANGLAAYKHFEAMLKVIETWVAAPQTYFRINAWNKAFGREACTTPENLRVLLAPDFTAMAPEVLALTLVHESAHAAKGQSVIDRAPRESPSFKVMLGALRLTNAYHYEAAARAYALFVRPQETTRTPINPVELSKQLKDMMGNPEGISSVVGIASSPDPLAVLIQETAQTALHARIQTEDMLMFLVNKARHNLSPGDDWRFCEPMLRAPHSRGALVQPRDMDDADLFFRETGRVHQRLQHLSNAGLVTKAAGAPSISITDSHTVRYHVTVADSDLAAKVGAQPALAARLRGLILKKALEKEHVTLVTFERLLGMWKMYLLARSQPGGYAVE
ncbi:hypothetical protein COCOR_04598 [Corallococcus coralloides DSM 2259]|uniref:Uncharacterized protein n=1 Tax=Corallococcus coralloides (strain ATCC 25202 / DSM 2259 / NBRC 100086 / M2) TaxID=1144275 RepID=H8MI17_CORCM|nr:hypothetical protein [Corallococcus coralloides]AFE05915.1 hypothetical protein COCOR_04598 [Corallococcus coralloides DSM 2259]